MAHLKPPCVEHLCEEALPMRFDDHYIPGHGKVGLSARSATSARLSRVHKQHRRRRVLDWRSSGRGAAWLARLLGVQEVPGSNPGGPTKYLKKLQTRDLSRPAVWRPVLHLNQADFPGPLYSHRNPTNPTFGIGWSMSGSPNFPPVNPTDLHTKPDIERALNAC